MNHVTPYIIGAFNKESLLFHKELRKNVFVYKNPQGQRYVGKFSSDREAKEEYSIIELCKDCPFIIDAIKLVKIEGFWSFLMPYYHLGDLRTAHKTTTLLEKKQISKQILQGLQHLHSRNVIHYDIKLSNIVIESREHDSIRVKIIDLGSAKLYDPETPLGKLVGKFECVAPEVRFKWEQDYKLDVWSFGILLYKMMMRNKYPFVIENGMLDYDCERAFENIDMTNGQDLADLMRGVFVMCKDDRVSAENCLKYKWLHTANDRYIEEH